MAVYYINLALILGLAYPLCIYKPTKIKKAAYLLITFGYMWFLAAFRYDTGFDYFNYLEIFKNVKAASNWQQLSGLGLEWGFLLLTKGMSLFVDSSPAIYGIYSLLILVPVAWFIYVYCKDAWLSTWLYVTLAFFYTSMNFIRQSLACGVVLLSYKFLREKKPVPYMLLILLAASFHKTALIMIPVYLLCQIKLTKKMAISYAAVTVFFYLTSSLIVNFATNYIYTYYKGTYYIDAGFPLVFLIVPFSIFGACLALRSTWINRDPDANLLFYLVMFSAIVWLFITRHFILERFSMYVYIFVLLALPAALSCLKASPEEYAKLAALQEEHKKGKGGKTKEAQAQLRDLAQKVSDHQKYFWSAVVGLLILTGLYNDFGANVNKFHNVFPYTSILDWFPF